MKILLTDKEIIYMIQYFVDLQEAIMLSFQSEHSEVKDWNYMIGCPKTGVLSAAKRTWDFHKHGSGIYFKDQNGPTIIDIIKWKSDLISAFDITRLVEYFASQNLTCVTFRDENYDISSEYDMSKIIKTLIEDKLIYETSDHSRLYILQ